VKWTTGACNHLIFFKELAVKQGTSEDGVDEHRNALEQYLTRSSVHKMVHKCWSVGDS